MNIYDFVLFDFQISVRCFASLEIVANRPFFPCLRSVCVNMFKHTRFTSAFGLLWLLTSGVCFQSELFIFIVILLFFESPFSNLYWFLFLYWSFLVVFGGGTRTTIEGSTYWLGMNDPSAQLGSDWLIGDDGPTCGCNVTQGQPWLSQGALDMFVLLSFLLLYYLTIHGHLPTIYQSITWFINQLIQ